MPIDETLKMNLEKIYPLPFMNGSIYWPRIKGGQWQGRADMMLAEELSDEEDFVYAIEAQYVGKEYQISIAQIFDALNRYPRGWKKVRRDGGIYPTAQESAQATS